LSLPVHGRPFKVYRVSSTGQFGMIRYLFYKTCIVFCVVREPTRPDSTASGIVPTRAVRNYKSFNISSPDFINIKSSSI